MPNAKKRQPLGDKFRQSDKLFTLKKSSLANVLNRRKNKRFQNVNNCQVAIYSVSVKTETESYKIYMLLYFIYL